MWQHCNVLLWCIAFMPPSKPACLLQLLSDALPTATAAGPSIRRLDHSLACFGDVISVAAYARLEAAGVLSRAGPFMQALFFKASFLDSSTKLFSTNFFIVPV
jgi:hypothetical protein